MAETVKHTPIRQWPDNITAGDIRYGKSTNYDGFYLADAQHGIPTIGSVADASPVTIRGQHVQVFNYPGQTEAIAKALCDRWNAYPVMLGALRKIDADWTEAFPDGPDGSKVYLGGFGTLSDDTAEVWRTIRAALAKAGGDDV